MNETSNRDSIMRMARGAFEERQRRELRSENIDEQARRYGLERQPGETDLELKKRIAFLKQAERRAGNR